MKTAIERVCLNDYSVTVQLESSPALGTGWRLGFLGILHMEVFTQRLEDEFDASVIVTPPSVPYKVKLRSGAYKKYLDATHDEEEYIVVSNPNDWPDQHDVSSTKE